MCLIIQQYTCWPYESNWKNKLFELSSVEYDINANVQYNFKVRELVTSKNWLLTNIFHTHIILWDIFDFDHR